VKALVAAKLLEFIRYLERSIQYSGKAGMVRRYFFTNGFDGAMSMLGIVLGTSLLAGADNLTVASAGLGAALAMFLSGFMGTYATEVAESKLRIKELHDTMLIDVEHTEVGRAGKVGAVIAAFLQGLGSLIFSLTVLSPYLYAVNYGLSGPTAMLSSIALGLVTLFVLGATLGKLTRQSLILTGAKMMGIGLITTALIFMVEWLF
jgi:predicted membrane protein (TIGR00267 family)